MSAYVTDLLYKNKYLCDNIENVDKQDYNTKLQILGRFLFSIIVKIIIIIFHMAIRNAKLAFNLIITDFLFFLY